MNTPNRGFDLPMPKPRRNNRQDRIEREEGVNVHGAVTYLEEFERGSLLMTKEIEKFSAAATAVLEGGLNEEAIIRLMQPLCPRDSHGNACKGTLIIAILKAGGRLAETYLK